MCDMYDDINIRRRERERERENERPRGLLRGGAREELPAQSSLYSVLRGRTTVQGGTY